MNQTDLVQLLLGFGILQGVILSIVLIFSKRHRKQPNLLLAIFLLVYSFKLFLNTSYSFSIGMGNYLVSILLLSPPIYLYVKSITNPEFRLKVHHLWHLALPVIYFIALRIFVNQYSITSLNMIYENRNMLLIASMFQGGVVLQMTIYMLLNVKELSIYRRRVQHHYSSLDKINLNWLNWLVYLFLGLLAVWIFAGYADIAYFIYIFGEPSIKVAYFFWAAMSVIILLMGYYGLLKPEVFLDEWKNDNPMAERKLSPTEIEDHKTKLIQVMQRDKPYLEPTLRLSQLAQMLNLNINILSLVINEGTGMNFNDFVNEYRVNEFKDRLVSGKFDHLTLLAIAYDSGFNSKSTFNAMFKKFTGITPNQFKIEHLK